MKGSELTHLPKVMPMENLNIKYKCGSKKVPLKSIINNYYY